MFGSHLSIAGGLHHALIDAQSLGMESVQIFTKNQRQWSAPPLTDEQIRIWHEHLRDTHIARAVSHDSYLINLASPDSTAWERSIAAFRDELERCEALGIPDLVTHPGAHLGVPGPRDEGAGLARVTAALDRLHAELPGFKVVTCLEVTAGQGTGLGWRLEHLQRIRDAAKAPERLAVCLDTAHLLAAGYDLTSGPGAKGVLQEVEATVGLRTVRVWHLNDSKVPRGKRVDRHEHIGHGFVSLDAFRVIVRHPAFQAVPKILETAKEEAADGRPWDAVNLEVLRRLTLGKDRSPQPSKRLPKHSDGTRVKSPKSPVQ